MKLFVGLGNPGPKYSGNRHNVGFMAVDRIADSLGFGPWRSKFQGLLSEGMIGEEKVMLLKPETFMNKSGLSISEAVKFYKIAPGDVVIFHDEIDLAPAKLRVKKGGGYAGHNGLRSLSHEIGDACLRVRMGVGHPGHKDAVPSYVLKDFSKSDQAWLEDMLSGIADGAPALAAGDTGRFQNAVALRLNPPRSSGAVKPAKDSRAKPQPAPSREPEEPETRSPLQKLIDKFK